MSDIPNNHSNGDLPDESIGCRCEGCDRWYSFEEWDKMTLLDYCDICTDKDPELLRLEFKC
jgi:hypothetical protein